ncbi:MAG: SpoIIE family protein phosphatase [Opitutae bacterium]|nr:SpoIIE family protein phosphatase [Opitutae bacterium]
MNLVSLKAKFAVSTVAIYLGASLATFAILRTSVGRVIDTYATNFAVKQAQYEKTKVIAEVRRDLALSLKLVQSPLIVRWALHEDDPQLKAQALEEMESARRLFKDRSCFLALDRSKHYYFNDAKGQYTANPLRYTLDAANKNDAWYFRTLRDVEQYELNVDYDNVLDVTKVWFNVIIWAEGRKIGVGGGGIDISEFIQAILHSPEPGIQTILFSPSGAIEGHREKRYMEFNAAVRGDGKKIGIYDLIKSEPDRARLREAVARQARAPDEILPFSLELDGRQNLAALAYIPELKWHNLVLVDRAAIIGLREFLPVLLTSILAILLIVAVIGWLLNRMVLAPLSVLSQSTREIAAGRYEVVLPERGGDEIGQLAHSFQHMARTVKDYTENLERKVAQRTGELQHANAQLTASNRLIMDSIQYAKLLQDAILPKPAELRRHLREHFVVYRPRDIVGGDFYYYREARDGFVLGLFDCTGHGVPGAFMAMTAHALMNQLVAAHGVADPARLLQELNRLLRVTLHGEDLQTSATDNGLEAALCCGAPGRAELAFAGARIALHVCAGGEVRVIPGDKQALGYKNSDPAFVYRNHPVAAGPDTVFYLTTDGLLDQGGGPKNLCYGHKRFLAVLQSLADRPLAEHTGVWEKNLADFQGAEPQRDDITFLGFRL